MTDVALSTGRHQMMAMIGLVRPVAVAASAAICLTGALLASPVATSALVLGMAAVGLAVAASNVFNDIVDIEPDRVNVPERPLPLGLISVRTAMLWCWSLSVAALGAALPLGWGHTVWVGLVLLVSVWYTLRLKRILIVGHLVIAALLASALLFGATLGSGLSAAVVVGAVEIAIFTFGRETLKGVRDAEGDRLFGASSIASVWGEGPAVATFAACCVAVMLVAAWAGPIAHVAVMASMVGVPGVIGAVWWWRSGRDLTDRAVRSSAWLWLTGLAGIFLLGS
jgi:geranylgeranylglycerol-phosphate geranylgeranyltransferase